KTAFSDPEKAQKRISSAKGHCSLKKLVEIRGKLAEFRGELVEFPGVGRKTAEVGRNPQAGWNYSEESW
ncbi:MAG: hypothetical protein EA344_13310, partial [Alkalicoccus sp.]